MITQTIISFFIVFLAIMFLIRHFFLRKKNLTSGSPCGGCQAGCMMSGDKKKLSCQNISIPLNALKRKNKVLATH